MQSWLFISVLHICRAPRCACRQKNNVYLKTTCNPSYTPRVVLKLQCVDSQYDSGTQHGQNNQQTSPQLETKYKRDRCFIF